MIGAAAEYFFSDLFKASLYHIDNDLFSHIMPSVSPSENRGFSRLPDLEEIKATIDNKNPNSAPGKDGFTGYLYRHCWDIIIIY